MCLKCPPVSPWRSSVGEAGDKEQVLGESGNLMNCILSCHSSISQWFRGQSDPNILCYALGSCEIIENVPIGLCLHLLAWSSWNPCKLLSDKCTGSLFCYNEAMLGGFLGGSQVGTCYHQKDQALIRSLESSVPSTPFPSQRRGVGHGVNTWSCPCEGVSIKPQ